MFTLIFEVKPNIWQTAQDARKLLYELLYRFHFNEVVLINECCSDYSSSEGDAKQRFVCQLIAPSVNLIKELIGKMTPQTTSCRLFINNTEYDVKVAGG